MVRGAKPLFVEAILSHGQPTMRPWSQCSSAVVRDRNDRPTLLLLAVMHDTLRIGAIANVVWGTQICMLYLWVYASAVPR